MTSPTGSSAAHAAALPLLRLGFAVLTTGIVISSLGPLAGADERAVPLCDGQTPTLVGTADDDELQGTADADVIVGLGGDDVVLALGGNDIVCGGAGSDRLVGGEGDDRLFGQADDVRLYGDTDHAHWGDTLVGGPGSDHLDLGGDFEPSYVEPETLDFSDLPAAVDVDLPAGTATSGADVDTLAHYRGVEESRLIIATPYDDRLVGTRDDDDLRGGAGDDAIFAGIGGDDLAGGPGEDRLYGGPDHDADRDLYEPQYYGDTLRPGSGDDIVAPGAPRPADLQDTVSYAGTSQPLRVEPGVIDGQGRDEIRYRRGLVVIGGRADDVMIGTDFRDAFVGGGGSDVLRGRGGADELIGDADWYHADVPGRGRDRLYGGAGRDQLTGGALEDLIRGGDGGDFLDGGARPDRLYGGSGRDREFDRSDDNDCRSVEQVGRGGC